MTAALGRWLILAALGCGAMGTVVGFVAGGSATGLRWTRRLVYAFALALIAATVVMEVALVTHDFSVSYVAAVGSRATPLHITVVSLWSSLEGSLLFWGFVLAVFVAAFAWLHRNDADGAVPYTLATSLFVGTFFAFLIAGPANPFGDVPPPIPTDGPGPNPLLQNHILMVFHPPLLYLGYVGMVIPFAMGVAALLSGRISLHWSVAIRRWMLASWGFLTAGIVLGGLWAYEVLGWGGYWAWDPVENASLLPWLTATAFLHTAMLQERAGLLKGWTVILLLTTFALTILGTFMTRSGVFNSVHAFTQSEIGPTLLVFLILIVLGSVLLLASRMHLLSATNRIASPFGREATVVVNNLLLIVFAFTVLVGTTFPLIAEAVRGVKISVGEPFFNQFAVPLGVVIVLLMAVGPALPWGRVSAKAAGRALVMPLVVALAVAVLVWGLGIRHFWPLVTIFVATLAVVVALRNMVEPVIARRRHGARSWTAALGSALYRGRRCYGGQLIHVGVAMAACAIALSGSYKQAQEIVLKRGESMTIGSYALRFDGATVVPEPHRQRTIADLVLSRRGQDLGVLRPAMNLYPRDMNPIGTPMVRSGLREDLYVSVMQVDPAGTFVGLRVYINPAMIWLWIGTAIMLLGCVLALWPGRREENAAG